MAYHPEDTEEKVAKKLSKFKELVQITFYYYLHFQHFAASIRTEGKNLITKTLDIIYNIFCLLKGKKQN